MSADAGRRIYLLAFHRGVEATRFVMQPSIAMGQSGREVRRAARRVTTSNEENGSANAVERVILRASRPRSMRALERS